MLNFRRQQQEMAQKMTAEMEESPKMAASYDHDCPKTMGWHACHGMADYHILRPSSDTAPLPP